jgi:hypothetical protein
MKSRSASISYVVDFIYKIKDSKCNFYGWLKVKYINLILILNSKNNNKTKQKQKQNKNKNKTKTKQNQI